MDIELAQALAENELLKSLLYCTKRSCNNCGKVNCENFQRQRKDCCENWVSYKDYIKQLEAQLTIKIINCIKSHLCKQDEDYDKPIISPKFLSDTLDQMVIDGFEGEIKENEYR